MTEKDIASQSRLLIELDEPESWLETLLREARRSALSAAAKGDETLAARWRKVVSALDQASAAMATRPETPMQANAPDESATQSQGETKP